MQNELLLNYLELKLEGILKEYASKAKHPKSFDKETYETGISETSHFICCDILTLLNELKERKQKYNDFLMGK